MLYEHHEIVYGIMTEVLVIHEIRIDKTADNEFRGHYATLTPISYDSPNVRCVAFSLLVIHENERSI